MEYLKVLIGRFLVEGNFLQAMNLCQDIINAEGAPDSQMQAKLDWIKRNTSENLGIPFQIVETYVSKYASKPLTTSFEVQVSMKPKVFRELELLELIVEMKNAYADMRWIVTQIAKKYSIDVPFSGGSNSADNAVPEIL